MPSAWFNKEQDLKEKVINTNWRIRVMTEPLDPGKMDGEHEYLKRMSSSQEELDKTDEIFKAIRDGHRSYDEFYHLFDRLPPDLYREIDRDKKFNLSPPMLPKQKKLVFRDSELRALDDYARESHFSGTLSMQDTAGREVTSRYGSVGTDRPIYAIHSVGKVLTGMLALSLIHQQKIPREILDRPVVLPETVLAALPTAVRERLKDATLQQLMTHQAGIGDYLTKYIEGIEASLKEGTPIPKPVTPQDFLPFADDSLSEIGQERYSNLGLLLTGLAIEHAYKTAHPEEEGTDYNELLDRFIIQPSGMTSFSVEKPDSPVALYNPTDMVAPYIAGSPAGGYWTSAEDLRKFGHFIYEQSQDEAFKSLLISHGQEFYRAKTNTVEHAGAIPSSSAYLSVSLDNGSTCAILSDQPNTAITLYKTLNHEMGRLDKDDIQHVMQDAGISGVSVASVDSNGVISAVPLGTTNNIAAIPITPETVFGGASLSKPVFAYLVLKLIEKGKFKLTDTLASLLPAGATIEQLTVDGLRLDPSEKTKAESLTVKMALSHMTGFPIGVDDASQPLKFQRDPGEKYGYSGIGYAYLQRAIEEHTGLGLEALAQQYVFTPLGMSNSHFEPTRFEEGTVFAGGMNPDEYHACGLLRMSEPPDITRPHNLTRSQYIFTDTGLVYYNKSTASLESIALDVLTLAALHRSFSSNTLPIGSLSFEQLKLIAGITNHTHLPANAANSLHTTASDYAKFTIACMNDEGLKEAFKPVVNMKNDPWAVDVGVSDNDLEHIGWGLIFGLQTNDKGEAVSAYQSGDMNEWRAWVAMDLEKKSAVIYFANSSNGHLLADHIIVPSIQLDHVRPYFFKKFAAFAANVDELEPGCRARIMSSQPEETDKSKVLSLNEVLIIRTSDSFEIGFCNKEGKYEQKTIEDSAVCAFLSSYKSEYIANPDDETKVYVDKINKMLDASKGFILKPNWQEQQNWGNKRQTIELKREIPAPTLQASHSRSAQLVVEEGSTARMMSMLGTTPRLAPVANLEDDRPKEVAKIETTQPKKTFVPPVAVSPDEQAHKEEKERLNPLRMTPKLPWE